MQMSVPFPRLLVSVLLLFVGSFSTAPLAFANSLLMVDVVAMETTSILEKNVCNDVEIRVLYVITLHNVLVFSLIVMTTNFPTVAHNITVIWYVCYVQNDIPYCIL